MCGDTAIMRAISLVVLVLCLTVLTGAAAPAPNIGKPVSRYSLSSSDIRRLKSAAKRAGISAAEARRIAQIIARQTNSKRSFWDKMFRQLNAMMQAISKALTCQLHGKC